MKPGNLDLHIRNKAYSSDFIYAVDPKNPTEDDKRKTEFVRSRLPKCIFSSAPGDAIYKRKPSKSSSQEQNERTNDDETGESSTNKRPKFTFPKIPPGLSAEDREEYIKIFGEEEEENEVSD